MRKIFFIVIACLFSLPTLAQKKEFTREQAALQRKNNVALTLGGNGLFLSVSYGRILVVKTDYFVEGSGFFRVLPVPVFHIR